MSIKDLLVHVDTSSHVEARFDTAAKLAVSQNAHLTGLYVVSPPDVPEFIRPYLTDDILHRQHKALDEMAEDAHGKFAAACGANGVPCDFRVLHGDLAANLTRQVRYYDLAVLGQRDPHEELQPGSREVPDQIVMSSGRPVMVVPHAGHAGTVGRNILVCWDASRLATRAVSDTLPLLVAAERVTVLVVDTHNGDGIRLAEVTGANITRHLTRHGVTAAPRQVSANGGRHVGETVLAEAAGLGADCIVMGAWGHTRWQEVLLGGLTRFMMTHMTLPVIMTH